MPYGLSKYSQVDGRLVRRWISGAIAFALGCPTYAQFARPGVEQQIQLGKQAARELRAHEKVLPSSDLRVQTLRRIARRIISTFDPKERWEYSFDIIDSKAINAFALPGGPTFFYTGLLNRLKTEDELAGVLGHELTHVREEHWSHSYRDEENREVLMTLGAVIFRPSRDLMNVAGITSTIGFELPYSRRHESEADDGGYESVIAAGYNPQGMADVFKMLDESVKDGRPPEFLSDHPSDKNRIRRIQQMVDTEKRTFPPQVPLPSA